MNQSTARKELAKARADGFCGFCFAKGTPGKVLDHNPGCKGVNDSGRKRPNRRAS